MNRTLIRVLCAGIVLGTATGASAPVSQKLMCRTGPDERHARIALLVQKNKPVHFAYYSRTGSRTCSIEASRNDAYSKWSDDGRLTTIKLYRGFATIERNGREFRVHFKEVEREPYCGMDGEINGVLTVSRGKPRCVLDGLPD